ncbi:MAG TPA: hypothetical protein VGY56_20655 [Verrucomicrobiae bacterium]|nr:hypothetical protein [Verrucomicrobiae bacterium]
MPKKSGLMSKDEAAICNRIKQFREFTKFPQPLFAELLDLSRDKLISIEYARTPVRFGVARRLCEEFNLSRVWLAEGVGSPHSHIEFTEGFEDKIPPNMLFSEAYRLYLRPEIGGERLKQLEDAKRSGIRIGFIYPADLPPKKNLEWSLRQEIRWAWQSLEDAPEVIRAAFAPKVLVAIAQFFKEHGIERKSPDLIRPGDQSREHPIIIRQMLDMIHKKISPKSLTAISQKSKSGAVKSEVQKLIARVKDHASQPGAKSKLARTLGIAPARISEWLSGEKEPGGEYTLLLLQWVEQQERQK